MTAGPEPKERQPLPWVWTPDEVFLFKDPENPLVHYYAPWRRPLGVRAGRHVLIILGATIALLSLLPLGSVLLSEWILVAAIGYPFLTIPLMLRLLVYQPHGEQLEALYLTRLKRHEILMGSLAWGIRGSNTIIVCSAVALFGALWRLDSSLVPAAIIQALLFGAIWLNYMLKQMRFTMAPSALRWALLPLGPFLLRPAEWITYAFAFVLLRVTVDNSCTVVLFLAPILVLEASFLFGGTRVAMEWTAKFFFREIEPTSLREVIFPRA